MSGICSCITPPITVPINCPYHCSSITRAITDLLPETTAAAPHSGTMYSGRCCADDLGPPTGHRDSPPVRRRAFSLRSEKAGAQVQAVGCEQQEHEQADAAEHADGF